MGTPLENGQRRRRRAEDGRGGPADLTAPDDGRQNVALEGREGLAVENGDDVLARPRVVGGLEALHGAQVRRLLAQADGEKFTNLRASCARRAPRTSSGYRRQDCRTVVARAARRAVVHVERGHVGRRQPGLDVEPGRVAPPLRDGGRREDDRDVAARRRSCRSRRGGIGA